MTVLTTIAFMATGAIIEYRFSLLDRMPTWAVIIAGIWVIVLVSWILKEERNV